MLSSADLRELLRSIDARARARAARLATVKAFGVSVVIHAVILLLLLIAASAVKPPWARWSEQSESDLPEQLASVPVTRRVGTADIPACVSHDDSVATELLQYTKRAVSGSAPSTIGLPTLPAADSSRVWLVRVDALCRRAAATINRAYQLPENRSRTLYLVGAGGVYLVVDTSLGRGRYGRSMVMDSSLARIVSW
jgi:hypothetical protein